MPTDTQPTASAPSPVTPSAATAFQDVDYSISSPSKEPRSAASASSQFMLNRNPSTPRIPQTPQEEADLTREVQEKTNAAMLALKKPRSNSNLAVDAPPGSVPRKRISPNQISTPHLISASTSVDTIPLRPPSLSSAGHGPSKIGSRFKKLRGTLRAKNTMPTGEEVTPFPLDPTSPPASQTAYYDPARLRVPGGPGAASATETGRFKVPIPSPPASAGPGLKGFMARFRAKPRMPETLTEVDSSRSSPQPSPTTSVQSPQGQSHFPQPQYQPPAPASESGYSTSTPRAQAPQLPPMRSGPQGMHANSPSDASDSLQQLFTAASNLGLDQGALNDLLARSHSTSSRSTDWTLLTRNNSSSMSSRPATHEEQHSESPRSTAPPNERPSMDQSSRNEDTVRRPPSTDPNRTLTRDDQGTIRKRSVRKPADQSRRPREGQSDNAQSAVLRRTIIFPSEKGSTIDLNALMRKSTIQRRRASASSVSKSVHERVPTPPPPKPPTGKRFSNDGSPPVPHLPMSLAAHQDPYLNVQSASAGGPIEKSSSTYDSL